jgi:hypothetical protein
MQKERQASHRPEILRGKMDADLRRCEMRKVIGDSGLSFVIFCEMVRALATSPSSFLATSDKSRLWLHVSETICVNLRLSAVRFCFALIRVHSRSCL